MRALFVSALAALFAAALTPSNAFAEGDGGPRIAPGAIAPSRTVRTVPRVADSGTCVGGQCGVPSPAGSYALPAASGSLSDPAPAVSPPAVSVPVARTYVAQPVSSGRTYRVPPPPPPPRIAADGRILRTPVPQPTGMVAPVRVAAPQVARAPAPRAPVPQVSAPVRTPVRPPAVTHVAPPTPIRTAAAPRRYVRPARTYTLPSECKT